MVCIIWFALYLGFSTLRKVKHYRVGNWNTYTFVNWNSKKSCKDLGAPSCMKSMHKETKDLWMYTCGIHLRTKSKQKYSIVFRKLNRKNGGLYIVFCVVGKETKNGTISSSVGLPWSFWSSNRLRKESCSIKKKKKFRYVLY